MSLKIVLGLLTVLLSTALGNLIAIKKSRKYRFFVEIENFTSYLKREISFSKTTIGRIVQGYDKASCELKLFLDMLCCSDANICFDFLSDDENLLLEQFAQKLGRSDSLNEIELTDTFLKEVGRLKEEEKLKSAKISALSTKMGFFCGLMLFVCIM